MLRICILLALVAACLPILAVPASGDAIADADQALLENRFADAISAYATAASDAADAPARARAWRGIVAARLARDEGFEAIVACARAIVADPAHTGDIGLAKVMEERIEFTGVPEHWDDLIGQAIDASEGYPMLQEYLLDSQISALRCRGEFDAAWNLFPGYADIHEFLVAGPFPNTGGSGIHEPYPPEHEIDTDAIYKDRFGRPFEWEPSPPTRAGRVNFDLIFSNEQDAVGYALTHVRAEEEMSVVASVFGSDAFRLWINGEPVLRERTTRLPGWSLYEVPVALKIGWNRVLLKAASEADPLTFTLSLCDMEGRGLHLDVSTDPDIYTGSEPPGRQIPESMPTYTFASLPEIHWLRDWRDSVQEEGLAEWSVYLLFLMKHGFEVELEEALDESEERFPGSAIIAGKRAELLRQTEHPGEAAALIRRVVDRSPEYAVGVLSVVLEALRQGDLEVAWDLLEVALESNPNCVSLKAAKATMAMGRGAMAEGLSELEELYEEAPQNVAVRVNYLSMLQVGGDEMKHRAALERALESRADDRSAIGALASIAYGKGEYDTALAYLNRTAKAGERVDVVSLSKGTVLEQAGRFDEALREFEGGLKRCPRSAPLLESAARVLLNQGEKERAAEYFSACAERSPRGFAKRELVRRLRDLPPLADFLPEEDVESLQSADLSWAGSAADAVRLLDSQHLIVYENGSHEVSRHTLTKILSRAGAEYYGEAGVPIYFDSIDGQIEVSRTIKSDGREIQADRGFGQVSFADLEPGDVVELRYVSRYSPSVGLPGHFWHRHFFQDRIPVLESRLAILAPSEMEYDTERHGTDVSTVTSSRDGWRLDVWEMTRMPALPSESSMPPATELSAWIDVSTIKDWREIARWYEGVSRGRLQPGREVQALAQELTVGAVDDSSKIHAVTNYVRESIQYEDIGFIESGFVPRPVDEVLRTRLGDCKDQSVLIVSLLQWLSVHAKLVLVNSRDYTTVPQLPSPGFTHCIVRAVTSGGAEYWIDPTNESISFPNVPVGLEGAQALLIDSSESSFLEIRLDPVDANGSDSSLKVVIDDAGGYSANGTSRYWGEDGAGYRFIVLYYADQLDEVTRDIIASEHPAAVVGNAELTGESDLDEDMVLAFDFRRAGAVSRAGNLAIFGVPWTIGRVPYNLVSLEERATPLVLDSWRGQYTEEVELVLPDGYVLQSDLPLVKISCDVGAFSISGEQREDGSIVLRKDLLIDALRVEPDEYEAFRRFLEEAWQAEGSQLVFASE